MLCSIVVLEREWVFRGVRENRSSSRERVLCSRRSRKPRFKQGTSVGFAKAAVQAGNGCCARLLCSIVLLDCFARLLCSIVVLEREWVFRGVRESRGLSRVWMLDSIVVLDCCARLLCSIVVLDFGARSLCSINAARFKQRWVLSLMLRRSRMLFVQNSRRSRARARMVC
jgi:hypothetical protein